MVLCIFLQAYAGLEHLVMHPDTNMRAAGPIFMSLTIQDGVRNEKSINLEHYLGATVADLRRKLTHTQQRSFVEFVFFTQCGKKILNEDTDLAEWQPVLFLCPKTFNETD